MKLSRLVNISRQQSRGELSLAHLRKIQLNVMKESRLARANNICPVVGFQEVNLFLFTRHVIERFSSR